MAHQRALNELDDTSIIQLTKQGNQLAFNQVYYRYWEGLYAYALNILKDNWLVEDVLHEVFTNIWLKRENLEITNLKSYLFTAVRNRSLLKLRATKLTELDEKIIEKLKHSSEVELDHDYKELIEAINTSAKKLPQRCRDIFYMNKFQHYSSSEIAVYFNISQRTVENQISLALKHLRNELGTTFSILLFYCFL
ncbi:RNA polymerase sigma-70 factor [Neptunitalea lumnitzerae]|uniref:DNA-directed RNA polymerase sigma-70 factor n=1 Tax=Neptunitalea lumnitzerae TaxID=2965509 RepID=A0ABQ5MMI8_9FLAO|nr:RNA polymerase sigma-70 factor [Neptunitalea sp. Y10]GLB50300.1 DNA-directed RNA polymerase sigma-70 factor [Neptunitalea sp. Y10]